MSAFFEEHKVVIGSSFDCIERFANAGDKSRPWRCEIVEAESPAWNIGLIDFDDYDCVSARRGKFQTRILFWYRHRDIESFESAFDEWWENKEDYF